MKLLNFIVMKAFVLFVFCMMMSNATLATKKNDHFNCPSVDQVRKAASLLKIVVPSHNYSFVRTDGTVFEDSKAAWKLSAEGIRADSDEEAIAIAQARATKITHVLYQTSTKFLFTLPLCFYYDDTLQNPYVSIFAEGIRKK